MFAFVFFFSSYALNLSSASSQSNVCPQNQTQSGLNDGEFWQSFSIDTFTCALAKSARAKQKNSGSTRTECRRILIGSLTCILGMIRILMSMVWPNSSLRCSNTRGMRKSNRHVFQKRSMALRCVKKNMFDQFFYGNHTGTTGMRLHNKLDGTITRIPPWIKDPKCDCSTVLKAFHSREMP